MACTFIGWVPIIAKMVPGHQKAITERIKGTTITVREARKEKRGRRRKKKVEKNPPPKNSSKRDHAYGYLPDIIDPRDGALEIMTS